MKKNKELKVEGILMNLGHIDKNGDIINMDPLELCKQFYNVPIDAQIVHDNFQNIKDLKNFSIGVRGKAKIKSSGKYSVVTEFDITSIDIINEKK